MRKILLIDDDLFVRETTAEMLKAKGFEVFIAEEGRSGIDKAREVLPDVIICDILMPGMNGFEVLNVLRDDPHTATIPFIFLTIKTESMDVRRGMRLGADDYLTKPVDMSELLATIQTRLKVHERITKRVDELRTSIALSVPHEFRTPLHIILGLSGIMFDQMKSQKVLDFSEMSEYLQMISEAGEHLLGLVEDLTFYVHLSKEAVDPVAVQRLQNEICLRCDGAADVVRKVAHRYRREADVYEQFEAASIKISDTYWWKAVEALVDNAFKFSPPETTVSIEGMIKGDVYLLSVKDHGRGMTSEQIAQIGPYIQFDRDKYQQRGTGLGLATVRKLIELHGGTFQIESIPQQGTVVQLSIPCIQLQ